jgi:hypothetical protein
MTLRIYIPTYRRVDRQLTWSFLPLAVRARTTLVCPADEATALRRATGGTVLVQPAHVTTISAKRQWIVDQCDAETLCMLDDDLRFSVRDPVSGRGTSDDGRGCALLKAGPRDVERMFAELEAQLNTYAHAGVSMRMGNQSRTLGWHENKRMCYVLAYRTNTLRRFARFDEIAHREDMMVTLRLLQAGYANSVSFEFTADQVYAAKGGEAAAGRSMDASNADAERLAAAFPDLVRVVEKIYKVSTLRKEVVVQWNKAWNAHLS